MNTTSTISLKDLIAQKKFDQAKAILLQSIRQEWSREKKGEVLSKLARAYMSTQDAINQRGIEFLQGAMKILEKIDTKEKKVKESGRLEDVRRRLHRM